MVPIEVMTLSSDSDQAGQEYHNYLVRTDREVGTSKNLSVFTHEVEYRGAIWKLPGKVVDQMMRHRQSIITELKRIQAEERKERMADTVYAQVEDAVESGERHRDLQGL